MMNAFNRAFIALLALAWVAVLGAAIWLIWDQSRIVELTSSSVNLNFDIIADTEAERMLATLAAGALMLPALMLLTFEIKPSGHRNVVTQSTSEGDVNKMQGRMASLEKDLAEERARNEGLRGRDRTQSSGRRWHLFGR